MASLYAGIVLGLSMGFSPGPFLMLVISQSLTHGAREGIKVSMAPLITDLPIILLSIFLLSKVVDSVFFLFAISLAQGLFLSYLAWENFQTRSIPFECQSAIPHSVRRGVLVNFLNPNPYIFWFTVGSPMVLREWETSAVSSIGFLFSFYGCLVGAKCFIALLAGKSRQFLGGKIYRCLMRFLGILLLLFAIMLFWNAIQYVLGKV